MLAGGGANFCFGCNNQLFNHVADHRLPRSSFVSPAGTSCGSMDVAGSPTSHRSSTTRRPLLADLGMLAPVGSSTDISLLQFVRAEPRRVSKPESAASQSRGETEAPRDEREHTPTRRTEPGDNGESQDSKERKKDSDVVQTTTSPFGSGTTRRRLAGSPSANFTLDMSEPWELGHIDLTGEDDEAIFEEELKITTPVKEQFAEEKVEENKMTGSPGPWWKSLLPSSKWGTNITDNMWLPKTRSSLFFQFAAKPSEVIPPEDDSKRKSGTRWDGRKELPKRIKEKGKRYTKPSLKKAMKLARNKMSAKKAMKNLENDFFANSSRASKKSKRHTVETLLKAVTKAAAYPLSVRSLRLLASTLKESGYKSASAYIAEAKIAHIEKGHEWTPLLERNVKLCKTAVSRGIGPRKKAPEVQEDAWALHDLDPNDHSPVTKVLWATHLFALAVHWMMREIEVAALAADLIQFSKADRSVMVTWEVSKNDPTAAGMKRVLKCVCDGACDLRCPYEVLLFLVKKAKEKRNDPCYLALDDQGFTVTKSQVVSSWQYLYGPTITGHSADPVRYNTSGKDGQWHKLHS